MPCSVHVVFALPPLVQLLLHARARGHTHTHQIGVEIVSFSISAAEFGLDVCFENLC